MTRNVNPDKARAIEVLPFEFNGAAAGYDEKDQVVYSLIFMPDGADPQTVPADQLVQVLLTHARASEVVQSLQSVMTSVPPTMPQNGRHPA